MKKIEEMFSKVGVVIALIFLVLAIVASVKMVTEKEKQEVKLGAFVAESTDSTKNIRLESKLLDKIDSSKFSYFKEPPYDSTGINFELVDNTPSNWSGLDYLEEPEEEEYPDSVFFGYPWKIMLVRYHLFVDKSELTKLSDCELNILISFKTIPIDLDIDGREFIDPSGPYLDWNTIHSKSGSILDSDDPLGLQDPKYITFVDSIQKEEKKQDNNVPYMGIVDFPIDQSENIQMDQEMLKRWRNKNK